MLTKQCIKCKLIKSNVEFYKSSSRKGGLGVYCKNCCKLSVNKQNKKLSDRLYYLKNQEKLKAKNLKYAKQNKEKINKRYRIYSQRPDRKQKIKESRILNKQKRNEYLFVNKERFKKVAKLYRENNKHILNNICAKRRASRYNATPNWLSKEHLIEIKKFYKLAKDLENLDNIKRHVDHIIPLQGETVCGLHVPWNLQILTAKENVTKKNKLLSEFM